jgi:hypothetical protein
VIDDGDDVDVVDVVDVVDAVGGYCDHSYCGDLKVIVNESENEAFCGLVPLNDYYDDCERISFDY